MNKILVFRPDQIGDVILMTPLFENLRRAFPDSEIISLTGQWTHGVLDNNPYVNKKIYYSYTFYDRYSKKSLIRRFFNIMRLIILVRRERVDLFIDLKGHLKTLLICYLSGARCKIGKSNKWRGFLLDQSIPYSEAIYERDNNLNVLSLIAEIKTHQLTLFPSDKEMENVSEWLRPLAGKPFVSIFPYAPSPLKRLPVEYFEKLIAFFNNSGYSVVILGGGDASDFISQMKWDREKTLSLIGKTTVNESYLVVEAGALCVSLDTIGAHLAVAGERPALVIFTYADPRRWLPIDKRMIILHKKQDCFPCKVDLHQKNCVGNRLCIDSITYSELEDAAKKLMEIKE